MLRVIHLGRHTIEAAPIRADSLRGPVRAIIPLREWIAFSCEDEIWSAPRPLGGAPQKIARSFDVHRNDDGLSVWVQDGSTPPTYVPLDANGNPCGSGVVLPVGSRIDSISPNGWVLRDDTQLFLWRRGAPPIALGRGAVVASSRRHVAITRGARELVLLELESATELPVQVVPAPELWYLSGTFSSDGAFLALRGDYGPVSQTVIVDTNALTGHVISEQIAPHKPIWLDGTSTLIVPSSGDFDVDGIYAANPPDWTLTRLTFSGNLPLPLIDMAALI